MLPQLEGRVHKLSRGHREAAGLETGWAQKHQTALQQAQTLEGWEEESGMVPAGQQWC